MNQIVSRHRPGTHARGEDTRRRILDAALEVFATEGYEGASTRLLAERAGVNLPAIQYYFGSKEGLYRAVIDSIVERTEAEMAPLAARVKAALARPDTPREELLELLCLMLEAFVALVSNGKQIEAKRLFFARAEVEDTPGLERLHESGMRQIFQPCLDLIGRLLGRSTEDRETVLRALTVFGQVTIFCDKPVRRILHLGELTDDYVRAIQNLVRSQTLAIFHAVLPKAASQP
jgi:TetR/AcrR family transcriptional regulator, regulator of cefoperazone and chloramphenicol sensitivity